MKKMFLGALTAIALGISGVFIVAASGRVGIGADTPHHALTEQFLHFVRERAIANRSSELKLPDDFSDAERVRRGAGNYGAMCANCHLSPEAPDSEIRQGLYPTPPNLSEKPPLDGPRNAARDFWIIKHGIKASGMPAWSKGGMEDEAIWDLAAFLQQLSRLSAKDYARLLAASDGHAHGGLAGHGHQRDESANVHAGPAASKPASHDHGSHKHGPHKH